MVILSSAGTKTGARSHGFLLVELMVALSLVALVMIPMTLSYYAEQRVCRIYYYQSIALEIVDGEAEILARGEWRSYSPGQHDYVVHSAAATNLPPGRFRLTLNDSKFRLEWVPDKKRSGGGVSREVALGITTPAPRIQDLRP